MSRIEDDNGAGSSRAVGSDQTLASDEVVPVLEEHAYLDKTSVTTGRVRVQTRTEEIERIATASLESDLVDVTRVPVGRPVMGDLPQIRTEAGVTIVPVFEEVLVVEKQLVLKEELHIRKRTAREQVDVPVTLRRQTADVERIREPE